MIHGVRPLCRKLEGPNLKLPVFFPTPFAHLLGMATTNLQHGKPIENSKYIKKRDRARVGRVRVQKKNWVMILINT